MSVRKALSKYGLRTDFMNHLLDKNKKCIVCGKQLTQRQKYFCSDKCKRQHYKDSKSRSGVNLTSNQTDRTWGRKLYFAEQKGGKCEKCGYNRNLSALTFHHVDETTKNYGLDSKSFGSKNLNVLKEEVDKCILLCANCHAELHHPHLEYSKIKLNESIQEYRKKNNLI